MEQNTFSGIWRSHYQYHSDSRQGDFENEHYVSAQQEGNKVILESVPGSKSYLILRLIIDQHDDRVLTGTWQETTEESGHYKGATYHGAIQLVVDPEGKKHMSGKWIGVGKNRDINSGPWDFTYVGETVPEA